jgi:hypothetical protein
LNYGPWYTLPFLGPLVYWLAARMATATREARAIHLNLLDISERALGSAAGIILLTLFVGKNLAVEWEHYHDPRVLGWVQAEHAAGWARQLASPGAPPVPLDGLRFEIVRPPDSPGGRRKYESSSSRSRA